MEAWLHVPGGDGPGISPYFDADDAASTILRTPGEGDMTSGSSSRQQTPTPDAVAGCARP